MEIPLGVLIAGALPEPQGVNPLAGAGSQAAVTDFRSKLLASLQTIILPSPAIQSSPALLPVAPRPGEVAAGAAAMGGGLAPVVAGEGGAPASAEGGVPGGAPQALVGEARDVGGRVLTGPRPPVGSGVVAPGAPVAREVSAQQAGPGAGQTGPAATQVGMRPPSGAAQGVKRWGGACEPDPELTGSGPSDAGGAGERAGAAVASGSGAERVGEGGAAAAGPAAAASSPQEAQALSGQAEGAWGGDQRLRVAVERRGEPVPSGRLTAPGGPLAPVASGREGAVRVDGGRSVSGVTSQRGDADEKGGAVEQEAGRAEALAVSVAFGPAVVGGGGEESGVSQRSGGQAEGPAVSQAVGAGASGGVSVVAVGVAGGAAAVGKEVEGNGEGLGSAERVPANVAPRAATEAGSQGGREFRQVGGLTAEDAVPRRPGRMAGNGEPAMGAEQALDDGGGSQRGGGPVEAGVAHRDAGAGENGFEEKAEEKTTPWGTGVGDAAGDGRDGIAGRARRVAARAAAQGWERGEGGVLARRAFELPGAIVAGARVETPHAAAEGFEGRERVASASLRELEELMPRLVVHQARLGGRDGASELRVRLHPPELGEIRVSFRSEQGELRGAVAVEREEVRCWVESQVGRWREDLSEAGLRVSRLEVGLLPRGGEGEAHGMPWGGSGAERWGGEGSTGFGPAAPAPGALEVEVEPREFGVNAAGSRGGLDYWA